MQNLKGKKIFVGMSGGVDSSVSALLLKNAGAVITGVFIKTWQPDYIECTWKEDRLDAMRICAQLDIPFITLDLEKEYKEKVIDYFLDEYKNNRVPNPDVMCNKYIKFDAFLNYARAEGARIATGHYAAIEENNKNNWHIKIPKDKNKDQTYFLYQIEKENLNDIIFPLSDLTKDEVRKIAEENNLWVAEKKDSQGICMLGGDVSVKDFLIKELNLKKGKVLNEEGDEIGLHDGVELYTIGERHGFDIVKKGTNSNPFFVYKKDQENNLLYVSSDKNKIENKENIILGNIILDSINLFENLEEGKVYDVMTRYRGEKYKVKLKLIISEIGKEENIKKLEIINFDKNEKGEYKNLQAVVGQSAVLYDGDILIGGGVIK